MSSPPPPPQLLQLCPMGQDSGLGCRRETVCAKALEDMTGPEGLGWGGEGRAGQMGELLGGIESDCK